MRVLIVNTSEKIGGAAIAARRLLEALINNGIKAKMLVQNKQTDNLSVVSLKQKTRAKFCFIFERIVILVANSFHKNRLFESDAAVVGLDITSTQEFKEADVIHLHWVNQGMISMGGLKKILNSGKPIVWTMHDMWPFTGVCHYNGECELYREACHNCPLFYGGGSKKDLSFSTFNKKQKLYSEHKNINFVACSAWLKNIAKSSVLLGNQNVVDIPNAINTQKYVPLAKTNARDKLNLPLGVKIILFTAYKATSKIKGIDYLQEACWKMVEEQPSLKDKYVVVAVGKDSAKLAESFPFRLFSTGYVSDETEMINIYNAADVFVIPSLQDNLPNTIVEAMSCGVPCVGFNVGGIPQMIEHKVNGYVANYKDSADLAKGIMWTLDENQLDKLKKEARHKAVATYSENTIANQYIEVYNKICKSENG